MVPAMTDSRLHHLAFVHLTALPAWLSKSREERDELVEREVAPVLAAHPAVSVRWVDVEAFSADSSDVLVAETDDLREWNRLVEALRDTSLFATPLFRLDRVLVGIEEGFRDHARPEG
jgi:chlorite dismutase